MFSMHYWPIRYFFALAAVALGMLLRLVLEELMGQGLPTFVTFYPIVIFVALFAGFGPGLLASLASALVADYWIILPEGLFLFDRAIDAAGFFLFLVACVSMSWIAGRYNDRRKLLEVTARDLERAKAAVESERQWLFDILETLPAYVVLLTEDYRVPFANRFYRERFGEPQGRRCYEYLYNQTDPCENCENHAVLKKGNGKHHWEWLGPDGRDYDINDYLLKNTDGTTLILEMGIDITEQKRAQEELVRHRNQLEETVKERTRALLQSEERLRAIYESMTEGLANHEVIYEQGRAVDYIITDVNPAYESITGLSRSEAVGRKASELYGTGSPPYLEKYAAVASGGVPEHFEAYFPPMEKHFAISIFSPERGKFVTVFSDITKRKQAESQKEATLEALRESEEKLNRAQEIAHLGSWELDLTRNTLTWSDEVYRIFGLKPQEFGATYEAFLEAVHPDDRAAVDAAYSESIREGRDSYDIEHRVVRRSDGGVLFVHERCEHVRDASGSIVRSIGMVHDITEQKKAENELIKLNENLEQFAYIASHDLQEPLRTMSSFSQLLHKRYKDRLDQDADEFIGFIVDSAARMQKLITDLLAYSRVGRRDADRSKIDLNRLFRKVTASMAASIGSDGGSVTFGDLPLVLGNETGITQLFQNLIANAVKFHGDEPPKIQVAVTRGNGEWIFSVRDNGIGIDPQYHQRIFQIFQRLHHRDKYAGTGIGLAICRKIVESHGGRIWVESEPSRGSTFYFTIPG